MDQGPYAIVRHPSYALGLVPIPFGMVLLFPGSLLVWYGAWLHLLMTVVRTQFEDDTLHRELQGYHEYAQRVRFRLIPGLW